MDGLQLGVEQQQKPALSQQQIQALHILEMDAFELHSFLSGQALENPFFQYEGPSAFAGRPGRDAGGVSEGDGDAYLNLRAAVHGRVTIRDHLTEQLELAQIPPEVRGRVRLLIERLDENGYLAMSTPQIAAELSVSGDEARAALRCLQAFSPAGVGARSLRECLLLQLKRSPAADPLALRIVCDHLDLLAGGRVRKLAQLCQVSETEILRVREIVTALNPKPGNGFASAADIPYAPPDLLVTKDGQGSLLVSLNPEICSKCQADADGAGLLRQDVPDAGDAAYIRERLAAARSLCASLRRRNGTLLSCGEAIVAAQRAFFLGESEYPLPCSMRKLAGAMDVHASTVTRALRNKTLRCGAGVYPLSFFFARTSYPSSEGEKTIAFVRGRIAALIRGEPSSAPLSDRHLSRLLAREGIAVSRRAVAKHREALLIPCSFARSGAPK